MIRREVLWFSVVNGTPLPYHYVGIGSQSKKMESHSNHIIYSLLPAYLSVLDKDPSGYALFAFQYASSFVISIGNFGYDTPTQGQMYSNGNLALKLYTNLALESAFPDFKIGKSPDTTKSFEFLRRTAPIGMIVPPWGRVGGNEVERDEYGVYSAIPTFEANTIYSPYAAITGVKTFLSMKEEILALRNPNFPDNHYQKAFVEIFYPFLWPENPVKELDASPVKLYRSGWVTAASENPYTKSTFLNGTGFIFECRSRGGYSHSFFNDNTFKLWAYGQELNMPSGAGVEDSFSDSLMAQNSIYVHSVDQSNGEPFYKHVCQLYSFKNTSDYVYSAGDAVNAYKQASTSATRRYVENLTDAKRHILFVKNKYFVIFDNLRAKIPLRYTWKDSMFYDHDFLIDNITKRGTYKQGNVTISFVMIGNPSNLEYLDLINETALTNPYTGKEYTSTISETHNDPHIFPIHNLWISNKNLSNEFRFFTIYYPTKDGENSPTITQRDELTAKIINSDGTTDVISFSDNPPIDTTIWVNTKEIDGFIANPYVNTTISICSDSDNDGYGASNGNMNIVSGCTYNGIDCNDSSLLFNPTAIELKDGKDNNCDGIIDNGAGTPTVISIEAEEFNLSGSGLEIKFDLHNASNGAYVYSKEGSGLLNNFNSSISAKYNFSLRDDQKDYYYVWGRTYVPDVSGGSDSFFVKFDSSKLEKIWTLSSLVKKWVWVKVQQWGKDYLYVNLSSGNNIIYLQKREDGAMIDKIIITNNVTYIPNDARDYVQAVINCVDSDNDGYGENVAGRYGYSKGCFKNEPDCNDNNMNVNSGVEELCDNNIDDNCDGQIDEALCSRDCTIANSCSSFPSQCNNKVCIPLSVSNCWSAPKCNLNQLACVYTVPRDCSDGVACTVDSCNEIGGCLHIPDDTQCSTVGYKCDINLGCIYNPSCNNHNGTFIPRSGETSITIEAENFCESINTPDSQGDSWIKMNISGNSVLSVKTLPDDGSSSGGETAKISFRFKVNETGNYNLSWRAFAIDGSSDSVFVIFGTQSYQVNDNWKPNQWHWVNSTTFNSSLSLGLLNANQQYEIFFRKREDGYAIDRIFIAKEDSLFPVGNSVGPNESFIEPKCGDGILETDKGEDCDDGNLIDGDGCASDCIIHNILSSTCGNSIVEFGEDCENGLSIGTGCLANNYTGGNVSCNNCQYDFSGCIGGNIVIGDSGTGGSPGGGGSGGSGGGGGGGASNGNVLNGTPIDNESYVPFGNESLGSGSSSSGDNENGSTDSSSTLLDSLKELFSKSWVIWSASILVIIVVIVIVLVILRGRKGNDKNKTASNYAYSDREKKVREVKKLLDEGEKMFSLGNIAGAREKYAQIKKSYGSLDKIDPTINSRIMTFYKKLSGEY
ncbi:MAG: MopE-related protein [Nanoarchaeota archaeon]|mgnify:CR=1 FL=1